MARFQEDGYIIDVGAQFIAKNYHETIELCGEIGLGDEVITVPIKSSIWNEGRLYDLAVSWKPQVLMSDLEYLFGAYSAKGFLALLRFLAYIIRRWGQFGSMRETGLMDLDSESFADLALRISNREVLEDFLQPVIAALLLNDPEAMGAIVGMNVMRLTLVALLTGTVTLKKGMGCLSERLYEKHKENIRLSTPAGRIVIESKKVRGVDTKDGFIDADAVVCATTATTALELMPGIPGPLKGALEKATYSPACHVVLGVENRPFPKGNVGMYLPRKLGSPLAVAGSSWNMSPDLAPAGELVHCFTSGKRAIDVNRLSDKEIVRLMSGEVKRYLLPEMPDSPRLTRVYRFNEALFCSPPGTLELLMRTGKESSSHVKGLYLAGEYLRLPSVETTTITARDAAELLHREFSGLKGSH